VARRLATDPPRSTIRLNPFLIGDPQTPFASDLEGNGVPIWIGRREKQLLAHNTGSGSRYLRSEAVGARGPQLPMIGTLWKFESRDVTWSVKVVDAGIAIVVAHRAIWTGGVRPNHAPKTGTGEGGVVHVGIGQIGVAQRGVVEAGV
jgi:hypothetical protein